jgi:hypothetical protein
MRREESAGQRQARAGGGADDSRSLRTHRSPRRAPTPSSILALGFLLSTLLFAPTAGTATAVSGHSGAPILAFPVGTPAVDSSMGSALTVHVGPEVPVSWSIPGTNAYFGFNDPTEAVDPVTHDIFVAWMGATGIDFARSTDRGASFGVGLTLPGSADFSNSTTLSESWNPSLAVGSNGTVYVAFIGSNTTNSLPYPASPVVDVSYDHGRSFAVSSVVLPNQSAISWSDRPYLAVAPNGDLDLTFNYVPNVGRLNFSAFLGNVVFTRSTDGGRSWSHLVQVSPGFPYSAAYPNSLVVERTGQLDLLYGGFPTNGSSAQYGPGREYFTDSVNAGRNWSAPVALGNPADLLSPDSVEIQGSETVGTNGTLYVVYESQFPMREIGWLLYSSNHGRTWSVPLRVFTGRYTHRGPDGTPAMMQVVASPGRLVYVGYVWNNTAHGTWNAHLRIFDPSNGTFSAPILVSTYVGANAVFPGTMIGLAELGAHHVSLALGVGVSVNGTLTDTIFNVVTRVS